MPLVSNFLCELYYYYNIYLCVRFFQSLSLSLLQRTKEDYLRTFMRWIWWWQSWTWEDSSSNISPSYSLSRSPSNMINNKMKTNRREWITKKFRMSCRVVRGVALGAQRKNNWECCVCKCERKLVSCLSGEKFTIKSGHMIHIIDLKWMKDRSWAKLFLKWNPFKYFLV